MINMYRNSFIVLVAVMVISASQASTQMKKSDLGNVQKRAIQSEEQKKNMEKVAVDIATYEFEAAKLMDLVNENAPRNRIDEQANGLINLSETVLDWARFRLGQCDRYLEKSLELKGQLDSITHDSLEKNYHRDGLLPPAPPECYHIKDLFIHPATVLVLTRDDPQMNEETRDSIKAEISEVLGHTEAVRQLVLY